MSPAGAEVGVIGGSGFYSIEGLTDSERVTVSTPFGEPSMPLVLGTLHGKRIAFITRHDEGHRLLPGELPARANIYALKLLGVRRVLALSAVGSLHAQYEPLQVVVPDQLIDRTQGRASTFLGDGMVAHVSMADPFCPEASAVLAAASEASGVVTHRGGTLVVIERPAFSTRAESQLYRAWGAAIIGMTALPETKLAREAELCYTSLCFVTDYGSWHSTEAAVSADMVMETLRKNVERGRAAVARAAQALPAVRAYGCGNALATALVTPRELVPVATRRRLSPLLEPYWDSQP